MGELVDIIDKEKSFPILMGYVEREEEALITLRSLVMMERVLGNWRGLYLKNPPRLTVEGACALLAKWANYEPKVETKGGA